MKKLLVCCFAVLGFVLFAAIAGAQQKETKKYAVVIGNQDYTKFGRLTKTRTDANDVDAALRSIGFTVNKVLDGNLQQMQAALTWLRNRLGESEGDAYGFFYYSGHGVQDRNGESYLIPVDADIPSENYVGTRALALKTIHEEMSSAGNQLNIIVLDACRDFPAAWNKSISKISKGLGRITYRLVNSLIVYATTPGEVAVEDSTSRHSLFTEHLLKYLTSPDLHVNEMFRRVSEDVVKASREKQIPQINGQYFGTAILNPAGRSPPIVPPNPNPAVSLYNQLVNATGTTTITVTQDTVLPQVTLSKAASITLRGDTAGRTISTSGKNFGIVIEKGVTLMLENITLRRVPVLVKRDSTLTINNFTTITGTHVFVSGTFTMQGGTITHSDNFGVFVVGGSFTMEGGTITHCYSSGVHLSARGTFIMKGGIIAYNNGSGVSLGLGVDEKDDNIFIMENGRIENNTRNSDGGGVCIEDAGTFIMNDGIIQNNISKGNGGGVYVSRNAKFYMKGGSIGGNTANGNGGGVYVRYEKNKSEGVFSKTGGIIYGSNAGSNANRAKKGNAVNSNNLLIDYTY